MTAKKNGTKSAPRQLAEARVLSKAAAEKLKAAEDMEEAEARLASLGDVEPEADLPSPEAEIQPPSKIERILEDLGTEGSFEIYHLVAGQTVKVGQYDVSEWPDRMEMVAAEKDGGNFKVVFRHPNGHHAGQLTRSFDSQFYRKSSGPTPTENSSATMLKFMEMMNQERRESELRMEKMRMENQTMLFKVLENLKPTAPAQDLAATLKVIKELTPPQPNPLDSIREIFGAIALLKEEADVDPAPAWQKALDKGLMLLKPLVEAGAAKMAEQSGVKLPQPGAGTVGSAALPAPAPQVQANPAPVSAPKSKRRVTIEYYAKQLSPVVGEIAPETVAGFTVDGAASQGEQEEKILLEFASSPGVVKEMIEAAPYLAPNKEWLEEFFAKIVEFMTPDTEGEDKEPEEVAETDVAEAKPVEAITA